jgi:acetyl-CoA C-acetyltransferase
MTGVVVSGVGMTKFGTHEETSAKDLLLQASVQALKDANYIESWLSVNRLASLIARQD